MNRVPVISIRLIITYFVIGKCLLVVLQGKTQANLNLMLEAAFQGVDENFGFKIDLLCIFYHPLEAVDHCKVLTI